MIQKYNILKVTIDIYIELCNQSMKTVLMIIIWFNSIKVLQSTRCIRVETILLLCIYKHTKLIVIKKTLNLSSFHLPSRVRANKKSSP